MTYFSSLNHATLCLKPYGHQAFFSLNYFTDNIILVKKLVCCLLIVWLVLMAGGANAHGISDSAHDVEHSGHMHASSASASGEADTDRASADPVKACSQSHCGHGHSIGLLIQPSNHHKLDAISDAPKTSRHWASGNVTDTIERPKWIPTTPAVVNL